MIFHVTTEDSWDEAQHLGYFEVPSLKKEGFIHMSEEGQVQGVLDRYFKSISNLVLLHVDESKIEAPLKYELAPSINEIFPHIYGTLNLEAVTKVTKIIK